MRWLPVLRLCFLLCAFALAAAPVAQLAAANGMQERASGGMVPDGCKGCANDQGLAGACMTICAVPPAMVADTALTPLRLGALFARPADDFVSGLSPLPDPPRPRPLLRA